MKTAAEILTDARARLSQRNTWTKGMLAVPEEAKPSGACPVCALGAVSLAAAPGQPLRNVMYPSQLESKSTDEALLALAVEVPKTALKRQGWEDDWIEKARKGPTEAEDAIVAYNDTKSRRKAEVLAWFDRAIERVSA